MIFLGAGASKIFGIKTLQEMSQDLIEKMKREGYNEVIECISNNLDRFNITPDFEAIYTIVEGLTDPINAIKTNGPFTAYICKNLEEVIPKHNLTHLLETFKTYLLNECKPKLDFNNHMQSIYDNFFSVLEPIKERRYIIGRQAGTEPSVSIGDTIATTNYDMIIELYHRTIQKEYADGFSTVKGDSFIKQMDPSTYSYKDQRWLIKLHGSIWQYKYGNNFFKTIEDPKLSSIPVKIEEEMVIYPTGEKPILRYPYFDFYSIFKMQRWETLIVIGYSFRDEPVNYAILENFENVKNCKMIVIDPKPLEAIQNLETSILDRVSEKIIPIKGKFGADEVFRNLEMALKVNNRTRYFERQENAKIWSKKTKAQAKRQGLLK